MLDIRGRVRRGSDVTPPPSAELLLDGLAEERRLEHAAISDACDLLDPSVDSGYI